MVLRHGAMDPVEGTRYGRMLTELTSEFTLLTWEFIYVIWNSWPFFKFHSVGRCVEQLAAVPGSTLFRCVRMPLAAVQNLLFSRDAQ